MLVPCFFKSAWTHLWLTPHSAAVLMECTSDSSVFLQVLAASAARGRHAALGRDGGVVGGRPAGTQVLLREPPVPQRLVRSAAHRRGQRHRTPQRTVLPTRQDCQRKKKKQTCAVRSGCGDHREHKQVGTVIFPETSIKSFKFTSYCCYQADIKRNFLKRTIFCLVSVDNLRVE